MSELMKTETPTFIKAHHDKRISKAPAKIDQFFEKNTIERKLISYLENTSLTSSSQTLDITSKSLSVF